MLSAEQGVMPHEWCRNYTRTRARPPERFSVPLHHARWRNHRAHIGCHGREIREAIQRRENAGGENQGRAPCEFTLPSCQREALCRPDLRAEVIILFKSLVPILTVVPNHTILLW